MIIANKSICSQILSCLILFYNSEKAKIKEREETWQKIENLAQKNPKVSFHFFLIERKNDFFFFFLKMITYEL